MSVRRLIAPLIAPVIAVAALAACQRAESPRLDEALRSDLSLASQVQPYQPQLYVSPEEQGYGYGAQPGYYPQPRYTPQPYYQPQPQRVVYRQAPARPVIRRSPAPVQDAGSAPVYGSAGGVHSGDEGVIKNTKRDAIIGAAAGAAIGVASTRNTLKGAIIGAAAGGLIGAVVGEKIDVRRPR